jgi:hypothetical protein
MSNRLSNVKTLAIEDIITWGINDACVALTDIMDNDCAGCCLNDDADKGFILQTFRAKMFEVFEIEDPELVVEPEEEIKESWINQIFLLLRKKLF